MTFFKNVLFQLVTVLGFHSNYRFLSRYHSNTKNVAKKADYLKNVNFVSQKNRHFSGTNVIFYNA